jgi:hypothetical protein
MKTPSLEIFDANLAVSNFKHEQMVKVMAAIIRIALSKPYFSPADLSADILDERDRQGCVSNSWNSLTALEIIERLPLHFHDPARKIFGGRIKNTNPSAKGRWVGCYRLSSKALAETWLARNCPQAPAKQITAEQLQLA